jgi:monoamine oxidase
MTIAVIGAGMAGVTAARTLADAGREVIVFEARDRIGGRVYTERNLVPGLPIEMGAEFIHGDRAPQWQYVRELELRTLHWEKQVDSLVRLETGEMVTMKEARQLPSFDITRTWDLPEVPVLPQDEDLQGYLIRLGFSPEQLQYTRRSFGNAMGSALHHISAASALEEMHDTSAGEGDYRILSGYDRIIDSLAEGIDIQLNTPIISIDWSGDTVTLTDDKRRLFDAERVVITLPIGVLQSDTVNFIPPLPAPKQEALGKLRMGPGMKIVYVFEQPILPEGISALYSSRCPTMWWSPSFGQDTDQFVMTAFATGDWARQLNALGDEGMKRKGLDTLRAELGAANVPAPVSITVQDWTADPYALGVYSTVTPGGGDCRAVLARPVDGKLFFAGEATAHDAWSATVHGAHDSGQRAAREILGM